jgi:hypothetical protein
LVELVDYYFESFTVYRTDGFWQGNKELSLCIEIIHENRTAEIVKELARDIKKLNSQEAVLLTSHDVEMELI